MTRNGLARVLSITLSLFALSIVPSSLTGCAHTVGDPDGGDPNGDPNADDGGDDGGFEVPDAHHKSDSGHKGDASPTGSDATAGDDGSVDDPDGGVMTFDQPGSTGRIPELPQEGEEP